MLRERCHSGLVPKVCRVMWTGSLAAPSTPFALPVRLRAARCPANPLARAFGTPAPAAESVDSQEEEEDCLDIVHPLVAVPATKSTLVPMVPGVLVAGDKLSDCPAVLLHKPAAATLVSQPCFRWLWAPAACTSGGVVKSWPQGACPVQRHSSRTNFNLDNIEHPGPALRVYRDRRSLVCGVAPFGRNGDHSRQATIISGIRCSIASCRSDTVA